MKKIYRSRKNRKIAGVCGGIAEYFDWDPTIVRLVAVFLILGWGAGFWVYIISWLVIPERPRHIDVDYEVKSDKNTNSANKNGSDNDDNNDNDEPEYYEI